MRRVYVMILTGAVLLGSIAWVVGLDAEAATAGRRHLSAPAPSHSDGALLTVPPTNAASERTLSPRSPLIVPTPVDPGATVPASKCRVTVLPSSEVSDAFKGAPEAFHLFANRILPQPANGTVTSIVNEPTTASGDDAVLYVGNWYAAVSENGGGTFGYLNPYDNFPQDGVLDILGGPFCCDQSAVYDPVQDAYFWGLLYSDNGLTNGLRVAVADGANGLLSNSWCWWDFLPELYGFDPDAYIFDFPNLTLSNNYLYITANVFETSTLDFAGAVVLRLPPADMRDCIGFGYDALILGEEGSPRCTAGAIDQMNFASHVSNTALRVFTWDEITDNLTSTDVIHTAYNPGPMTALCTDGSNLAGRADDRVLGAWAANGELGFMWNAGEDATFAFPYVEVLRIDEATKIVNEQVQIYSDDMAFLYPSVHPNDRGHLGGTLVCGGGSYVPDAVAFIADDFNSVSFDPLEIAPFALGDSDPGFDGWGDYLSASRNVPYGNTWCGTGYAMVGGSGTENVEPHYVWFGRERDCPGLTPPISVSCHSEAGALLVEWSHVVGAEEYCVYRDGNQLACTPDLLLYDFPPDLDPHCYTVMAKTTGCTPGDMSGAACAQVAPANDNCGDCEFLFGDVVNHPFSNLGATTDGPDACTFFSYSQIGSDVWFCWQSGCSGDATISLCGSSFDTKLAVYEFGACPPSGPPLACIDDYCGIQSQVTIPVTEGQLYLIRAGGFLDAQGLGLLNISMDNFQVACPAGAVAEGEDCGLSINGGCNFVPAAYSDITCGVPVCGTLYTQDGSRDTDWYRLSLANPQRIVWTVRSEIPIQINIVNLNLGCPNPPSVVSTAGPECVPVSVAANLPAGEYALFVAPQTFAGHPCGPVTHDYTAWMTCNDDCEHCEPLVGEFSGLSFTNYGTSTDGPDELLACNEFGYTNVDSDVWFCWSAECTGDVTVSLCGSAYDTRMAVYQGGCPVSAPALACNDDFCGVQSELTFPAVQGQDYMIRVGGYLGVQGVGELSLWYETECACDCPNNGDTDGDGNVDALDLQVVIDVVFFGGAQVQDPSCPVSRMDINCDSVPDAVDIQFMIDYIFFGGAPPCDGCNPPLH